MSRVAALVTLVAAVVAGNVASATPTVRVKTDVQERHYDVYGKNADEVFASIQRQNLGGPAGLSASGLTRSELSYSLSTASTAETCRLLDLELRARVVVTLPRHARPTDLGEADRREWSAYEAQVEFHEYRHVEIEFQGLEELQARLERDLPDRASDGCTSFIDRAIAEQNEITRGRHEAFHRRESRGVQTAQQRLRSEIEAIDVELRRDREEIDGIDATLDDLAAERAALARSVDELTIRYGAALPEPAYTYARTLEQEIDATSGEIESASARRTSLVVRHNERLERRRGLTDRLAWTR